MLEKNKTAALPPSRWAAQISVRGVWLCGLIVLVWFIAASARAEGPDEQYLRLYAALDQADAMVQSGQTNAAKAKYRDVQTGLLQLKQDYPTWNARVVSYRLNYIAGKLADLSRPPVTLAAEPATSRPLEAKTQAKPAAATPAAQVKLLEPGAEPRKALRLQVKAGDKQTVEMITKTAMGQGMGDAAAQATKLPTIKMVLEVTVKGVSAEGDIAYETVIGDAALADEPGDASPMAEMMKGLLGGLKGMASKGTTSHCGLNRGSEVKGVAGADPLTQQFVEQMKDAMSRMTIPLPEEAVGPGAKWEVQQVIKSQGMTMDQTATYECVSLEGDLLKVKSRSVQQAGNQKIQNPAMPGVKLDLAQLAGNSGGEVSVDLTKLMPVLATVQAHSEATMAMDMGGQKQTLTVKTDTETRLESK